MTSDSFSEAASKFTSHPAFRLGPEAVYIEGRSPKPHEWEPLERYMKEYEHPLWKGFDQTAFKKTRGHGGGPRVPVLWKRLLHALSTSGQPDMNVYDAVTWSAISPLTERSAAAKAGRWISRISRAANGRARRR